MSEGAETAVREAMEQAARLHEQASIGGLKLEADQLVEQIPRPIVDLARELLKTEEGSPDRAKLTEVFRLLAVEANAVLYRMSANRIGAKLPKDAFEGEAEDIDAPGYERVDLKIGLQGKKNPAE